VVTVKRLSIAIDAYRLISEPLTSGAIYASELVQALSELHEVEELYLLVPSKPQKDFIYKDLLGIRKIKFIYPEIERFPAQRFRKQVHWIQVEIPRLVRNLSASIDFYIAPYHHPPILLPKNIRVVTVIHDLCGLGAGFPKTKKPFYQHLLLLTLSSVRSDRLIPISEFTKKQLQARFKYASNRVSNVVYNTVACKPIDPRIAEETCLRYGFKKMEYFLGFAVLNARKGLDIILDSFKLYKANGGKAMLVLIVAGRFRTAVEELIKKSGLHDVFLVSDIDFVERDSLYRCSLALLFPSRCEGFGYPVVEAMRQGCPPIAWMESPAQEIVGDILPLLKSLNSEEVAGQMHAYEELKSSDREMIANKLAAQSSLFAGGGFGREFLNAMTRGWQ